MRMDEMNKLFEEHGFTVERKWESEHNWYRFTISKDGKYQVGTYTYPNGANGHAASQHQRMFVEKMIKDFERSFDYKILMNSIYGKPAVDPRYRNDALCAYVESVGGFGNCLKKYEEEMWPKMNPYLETLRLPSGRTKIKNVIFNEPATIVLWTDGTKTVVKCQDDDIFDPEKGLAMAISKKALGNKGNYCNELKKWLPKEEEDEYEIPLCKELTEAMNKWPSLIDRLRSKLGIIALKKGYNPVQKAYDLAVEIRDEAKDGNKSLNHYDIAAIIGYLGEALED